MQNFLSLLLISVICSFVVSTSFSSKNLVEFNCTENNDPRSCSENCYFSMRPLLKYAAECHKKDTEICNLRLTIRQQGAKLDEQCERVKHLNSTVHEKDAKICELNSQITSQKLELESAKTHLETNSQSIKNLTETNDNILKSLEEELKNIREELKNAQFQLEDKCKTIQNLATIDEVQKRDINITLKNLEEHLRNTTQELKNGQIEIEDKYKTIQNLTSTNTILKTLSESLEEHLKNSREELWNSQAELEDKSKSIQNLAKINEVQKREFNNNLESLEDQLKNNREELQNAQIQLEDKSNIIRNLTTMYEIHKDKLKYAEQNQFDKYGGCQKIGSSEQVYEISVPVRYSFQAVCKSDITGSGWIVIQRRVDGNVVDFNRNWEDYKFGFGDFTSSFFIGLEKLHLLTQTQTYELYIQMSDRNTETKYVKYDNFVVGSEEEGYELKSVGQHSGTAVDALSHLEKMKFTTIDRDNDYWNYGNCAKYFNGGWWFENCGKSCLNGNYISESEHSQSNFSQGNHYYQNGPHYDHYRPHHHYHHQHYHHHQHSGQHEDSHMVWDDKPLTFTQMMIRVKM